MSIDQFPPRIPSAKAQQAADEVRRLEAERHKAVTERGRLERARNGAVEADREAYAAALRGGKKEDPGTSATEKADKAIAAARRRDEALATAAGQTRAELAEVIRAERSELERVAEENVEQARERFRSALEGLVAEQRGLSEALGFSGWLAGFPETIYAPAKHTPAVRGIATLSGDPPRFEQVAEALACLAEPLRPAQPAGAMPRPNAA